MSLFSLRSKKFFSSPPPRNYSPKFYRVLSPPKMKWDLRPYVCVGVCVCVCDQGAILLLHDTPFCVRRPHTRPANHPLAPTHTQPLSVSLTRICLSVCLLTEISTLKEIFGIATDGT